MPKTKKGAPPEPKRVKPVVGVDDEWDENLELLKEATGVPRNRLVRDALEKAYRGRIDRLRQDREEGGSRAAAAG